MRYLLMILTFFVFCQPYAVWGLTAKEYLDKAKDEQMQGDYKNAVTDMEKALESGLKSYKDQKTAQVILGLCLEEAGFEYYRQGDYEKSLPYLKKLSEFYPEEERLKKLFEGAEKLAASRSGKYLPKIPTEIEKQQTQQLSTLLESWSKKQKGLFENYKESSGEQVKGIFLQAEKERESLLAELKQREKELLDIIEKQQRELRQTYLIMTAEIIVLVILVIILVFSVRHHNSRREATLHNLYDYQQKILSAIESKNIPFQDRATSGKPLSSQELKKALDSIDSQAKLRGIEVIETELISKDECVIGERLLQPFLKDKDLSVKSRAVEVFHKFNPDQALKTLREMSLNPDKTVRLSAVSILSKLNSLGSIPIFLDMQKEPDKEIQRIVIKTLYEINSGRKMKVPDEFQKKIQKFIDDVKAKKEWVIE